MVCFSTSGSPDGRYKVLVGGDGGPTDRFVALARRILWVKMGLGVLPDKYLEHVPGTSLLSESGALGAHIEAYEGVDQRRLKHDKTGRIVLVPQVFPSEEVC